MKRYLPLLIVPVLVLVLGATTYRSYRVGVQNIRYGGGKLPQTMISGVVRYADGLTPINVLAFGVDNTGATDCADSLQAVVDSVMAWGGGTIYLPAGTYLVESEILVNNTVSSGDGVKIVGDGRTGTVVNAGADSINVFHWAGNYGGIRDVEIYGNGFSGVTAIRLTPEDEAQVTTYVNQQYNAFKDLRIRGCAEGIVLQCGPYVAGTGTSGCHYNTFDTIRIETCLRGIWFKDGPNASSSGSNRNQFYSVRIGGTSNTGIQIDDGATNTFYGCSLENITSGSSPNATPTGIYIAYSGFGGYACSENYFYGLISETVTRDLYCEMRYNAFIGTNIDASGIDLAGAGLEPNVFIAVDPTTGPSRWRLQQFNGAINDSALTPQFYVKGGSTPIVDGFHAYDGSLILHTNGNVYVKKDASDTTGWEGLRSWTYNVKDYGAVGSGSADDTAEIQAAIDAAEAVGYAEVVFPAGSYKITDKLTLEPTSHITLSGAGGQASKILLYDAGGDTCLVVDGWYSGAARAVTIKDLGFYLSSGTGAAGIALLNSSKSIISGCYISGFAAGPGIVIDSEDGKKSTYNKVTDTYVGSCDIGILIDHTATTGTTWNNGNSITNCSISTNSSRGVSFRHTGGMGATLCAGHSLSDSWIDGKGVYLGETMTSVRVSNVNIDGSASDDAIGIAATAGASYWSNITVDGGYADSSGTALFTNCHFSRTDYNQMGMIQSLVYLKPMSVTPDTVGLRGLIYFDKTTSKFRGYVGGSWVDLH